MSRFDDELRGATAPLAREQLPEGMLDESFNATTNDRRWVALLAGSAAAIGLIVVVAWGAGRLSLPVGSQSAQPSPSSAAAGCSDIEPISALSTEYRVYFPCADGAGLASAPRVMAMAPAEDALASAIRDVLNGPVEPELAAGMASLAPAGSGDLLRAVELQADGLAVLSFHPSLRELSLDPRFLDAIEATGLQFDEVTALELRLGGSCAELFAIFGAACDHLAKHVQIAGDCPVVPPAFLPSGAGITKARPFPGKPRTVSWGVGDDTVIQEVGERGGTAAFEDGREVTVRGYPGRARPGFPEFVWVEDGCPYRVTLPGQGEYAAVDYATGYGPVVAEASPTPLPSAPFGIASVEQDGIRLTLALDREATTFGERVWADVTVENIGSDVVIWGHSSTCTWPAGVWLSAAVEPPPIGRTDWPGDQGVLKNITVSARSTDLYFTPEAFADFEENGGGCTSDLVGDEIQPVERLSDRFAWDTRGQGGMPPPGGRYVAESTFFYMGRGTVPPEARPDEHQVTIRVALDVEPPARDYLSPGLALDLLLADPEFIQQLAANPRERWTGADLSWDDERWIMELRLRDPDQAIIATVDAISGNVSGVQLVAPPSNE
jgi:hypothetical protein